MYGTRPNVPDLMLKGGVTYRIISDPLGSPVEVINTATGAVVEQISYDAWGSITSDTNPGFQPFGFAGGLYDADTGLVHFGARDYDPVIGRWTTRDPLGFASADTDLYAYVESDPVNAIDPTGLFSQQQLQNIIYNETASLSGLGIDQADVTIAYILQNRSNAGINGGVAPDTLSLEAQQAIRNGDAAAVEAYKRAAAAAARAIKCPHNDPTHGAKGYNLRKNSSTAPRFGNPADPVIMHFGPFNNSYPTVGNPNVPTLEQLPATGVYVDIYKW